MSLITFEGESIVKENITSISDIIRVDCYPLFVDKDQYTPTMAFLYFKINMYGGGVIKIGGVPFNIESKLSLETDSLTSRKNTMEELIEE